MKRGNQMLFRNRAFGKELFHEFVFPLGHQFNQCLMRRLSRLEQLGRNLTNLPLAIRTGGVEECLHRNQVDHSAKGRF